MREENLRFMQYCAMNRKEDEEREKELERIVNEEVEKKWAQTIKQYKMERDARQKLLANVMKSREQQIEERSKLENQEHNLIYLVLVATSSTWCSTCILDYHYHGKGQLAGSVVVLCVSGLVYGQYCPWYGVLLWNRIFKFQDRENLFLRRNTTALCGIFVKCKTSSILNETVIYYFIEIEQKIDNKKLDRNK